MRPPFVRRPAASPPRGAAAGAAYFLTCSFACSLLFAGACAPAPTPAPSPRAEARPPRDEPPGPDAEPRVVVSRVEARPARLTSVDTLTPAPPAAVGLDSSLPARLDSIVGAGLADGASPGAVLAVGRYGRLVHLKGYGTLDRPRVTARPDARTLYDLASLTKVVATTTAAMILEEESRLEIDRPVRGYVPEFDAPDKAAITVRMLLTHTAGFEAGAPLDEPAYGALRGRAAYLRAINARPLRSAPGARMAYSDWDMVLLQAVLERVAGRPLDQFVAERVLRPLGMRDARFNPDTNDLALRARIAPTAVDSARGGLLRGVVHDGNAWALGGVSGHAGLFASARDLAVFAQMLLNGGTYNRREVLASGTIARWTTRQLADAGRGLGWETPSPGSSAGRYMAPRAFGHTGFTGTSLWVDPERGLFVVLLMNRIRMGEGGTRYARLRREVADAVGAAVRDQPVVDWDARR